MCENRFFHFFFKQKVVLHFAKLQEKRRPSKFLWIEGFQRDPNFLGEGGTPEN